MPRMIGVDGGLRMNRVDISFGMDGVGECLARDAVGECLGMHWDGGCLGMHASADALACTWSADASGCMVQSGFVCCFVVAQSGQQGPRAPLNHTQVPWWLRVLLRCSPRSCERVALTSRRITLKSPRACKGTFVASCVASLWPRVFCKVAD